MRNILQATWRQVCAWVIVELPPQNPDEQKRLSWARLVESYAAVPDAYKDFFEPFRAEGRPFPYTLLTPTFEGFIRKTTEKLVCAFEREIYVLKRSGNTFEAVCFPLEGISHVETRTILLDSSIKISSVTEQGVPSTSTFRFSSASDELFAPILERIRLGASPSGKTPLCPEWNNFDQWTQVSFKFRNYARRSALPGEKIVYAILQPEIRVRLSPILSKTYSRRISRTHATILTDRELIVIREDERQRADARYSGVWEFFPLNKIVSLTVSDKENDLLLLTVHLPGGAQHEYLFEASAKPEIGELLDRHKALSAA